MTVKFENPPINELIICSYFNPILHNLRSEHVGLFWSYLRDKFPSISQNNPLGNIEITSGSEIFPMPRFWLTAKDDTTLIQIQKNAFMFNWRKRDKNYPHYDTIKPEFDKYYTKFIDFLKGELGVEDVNIDVCELAYVNVIEPCEYWKGPEDTQMVLPSFSIIDAGLKREEFPAFNHVDAFKLSDELEIRVAIRLAQLAATPEVPALVLEIRAKGRLGEARKSDADAWFEKAHSAIGDCFMGMTNPEVQNKYWIPMKE